MKLNKDDLESLEGEMSNELWDNIREQIWIKIRSQVSSPIIEQIWTKTTDSPLDQIKIKLQDKIYDANR